MTLNPAVLEQQSAATMTQLMQRLMGSLGEQVVISPRTIRLVAVALLARGHVLLEDAPGVGKTLLARTLAGAVGGEFHRIQFTPDLLPADITGGSVYDPKSGEFSFRRGPIFANVVLADEINRGTPRAQSALLEAMGEGHVSADGETYALPQPFLVIATQNPVEQQGTFPLPEAELDRFLMLLHLGRPDAAQAEEILRRHEHADPPRLVPPVMEVRQLQEMQAAVMTVQASPAARAYVAALALATANHPAVVLPASPRAMVALLRAAQAVAALEGRQYVIPSDIQEVAPPTLGHRLGASGQTGEEVVAELLQTVAIPHLP